jgi:hypothetical protein
MSRSLAWCLLLLFVSLAFAGEQTDKVMERFDKQVEPAREAYEKAIARAVETTISALLSIGERHEKAAPDEARAAYTAVLKLDRNNEKARSYFQKSNELDTVLTKLTREWSPLLPPEVTPEWEERTYFETMLGRFASGPVTLVVPNGANVLPDPVKAKLKALTGQDWSEYRGDGKFLVKEAGDYLVQAQSCNPSVDNTSLGLTAQGGSKTVRLEAGVHTISVFTVPGIPAERSSIAVLNPRTRQRLPIFQSLADIKRFLSTPMNGRDVVDVSGWDPARVRQLPIEMPHAKQE